MLWGVRVYGLQIDTFREEDPAVLGVFSAVPSKESDIFLAVAAKLSDDLSFAHTTSKKINGKTVKAPAVLLSKKSEGKEMTYDGKFEIKELESWIETRSAPLLIDLDE